MALSGKVAVRDVTRSQRHTAFDGFVRVGNGVVFFVLILDVIEDLNGLVHTGWFHQDLLEPAFQSAVFSMCWRYSSSVVAPMHWISPLAKAGLNILEASKEPLAPPAPTMVWISSMNRMTSRLFLKLIHHRLHALLELPAVFGAGDQRGDVRVTMRFPNRTRDTFSLRCEWRGLLQSHFYPHRVHR